MPHQKGIKPVAQNRKAWHDYFVEEKYECGMELFGTEVKSMRQGRINLKESWAVVRAGEVWVEGMHISPYEQGNQFNRDPLRPKRLLLHKSEIRKLDSLVQRQGYTLIPHESLEDLKIGNLFEALKIRNDTEGMGRKEQEDRKFVRGLKNKKRHGMDGKNRYADLVAAKEQENAALEADIAQGPTDEKLQEIARDELGLVKPDEYVFEPSG